jgi:hypothetical protein
MKEISRRGGRKANYARPLHQFARKLRRFASSNPQILPSDLKFMHVVQKFDVTVRVSTAEIAWL